MLFFLLGVYFGFYFPHIFVVRVQEKGVLNVFPILLSSEVIDFTYFHIIKGFFYNSVTRRYLVDIMFFKQPFLFSIYLKMYF